MSKIIMLRGLPASGKSTWAREQIEGGPGLFKRVNKDDLRAMIDGGRWSKFNEKAIVKARDELITTLLTAHPDINIIVDDTNLSPVHEKTLRVLADKEGADFEIKDFYVPVSVAEERDAKRPNGVGADVIRRMWRESICKPYVMRPGLPQAVLCDIDGTIAHMEGRSPYEETRVGEDRFDALVAGTVVLTARENSADLIVVSGRHQGCQAETRAWLKKHNFGHQQLIMRVDGDTRKDYIIKEQIFNLVNEQYNIVAVFDDRQQVCDMWREKGIKVFQVDDGRF